MMIFAIICAVMGLSCGVALQWWKSRFFRIWGLGLIVINITTLILIITRL